MTLLQGQHGVILGADQAFLYCLRSKKMIPNYDMQLARLQALSILYLTLEL